MLLLEMIWPMEDKRIQTNIITADLRKAFSFPFIIAVLGIVICFCFDNMGDLKNSFYNPNIYSKDSTTCVHYFFFNAFSFGGVFVDYFACMLSALPFAANYSNEYLGGIRIYKITRCGRKTYARSKMIVAALSGGAVMVLGGSLFVLILATYLPLVTPNKLLESQWIPYYSALATGNGFSYFVIVLYIMFLSGWLWASVGMCVSAFMPNPYVAVCAPMIIDFLFVEIGRLTKLPYGIRFDVMLKARGIICSESITLIVITLTVLALWYFCYRLFLWRVSEGLDEVERC